MEPRPVVEFAAISLRYRRQDVLSDLSFRLHPGEIVGLIGPGASGKTQLLRTLATLVRPTKGRLYLVGTPVTSRTFSGLAQIRRQIGLQFQNFALFDQMTVAENVAFSLRHNGVPEDEVVTRVEAALSEVDLLSAADKVPLELSGGMRRRVAIARVMASQPAIALFDDPVSGLDPVQSARIMAKLQAFARKQGNLTIIATHDLERLFPICTRVLFLFEGRLLWDGRPDDWEHSQSAPLRRFCRAALSGDLQEEITSEVAP